MMQSSSSPRYNDENDRATNGHSHDNLRYSNSNGSELPLDNDAAMTSRAQSLDEADRAYHSNRMDSVMREPFDGDYRPPVQSSSYLGSFCRKCCTLKNLCYVIQIVNCGLVAFLIFLAYNEYPKIEALQKQVEADKAEIADLREEVTQKQEGQIQSLHKAVEQEQQFNFLTLAGTFTLLTCLISMFHMSMHLQKMNQPKIQRKIIAILWMSPIYSVTSFLTLIVPSLEGWMALIKDFYESYCIYTFLSFLIAVIGEGSRDKAVEVLAKHAGHLDNPNCCLGCFYDPPPDTSDHAKANAIMTQCQIYCLQFTLVRPITTIIHFFVLQRGKHKVTLEEDEEYNEDDEFKDNGYDGVDNDESTVQGSSGSSNGSTENNNYGNNSDNDNVDNSYNYGNMNNNGSNGNMNSNGISNSNNGDNGDNYGQEEPYNANADGSSPTSTSEREDPATSPSSSQFGDATTTTNSTSEGSFGGNGGTRTLAKQSELRRQKRSLQVDQAGEEEGEPIASEDDEIMQFPTVAPRDWDAPLDGDGYGAPTYFGGDVSAPTVGMEGMPIANNAFPPTFGPINNNNNNDALAPTVDDPYAAVVVSPGFQYNNTGFGGSYDTTNTTANVPYTNTYPTLPPSLPPVAQNELVEQSKDFAKHYFRSAGFANAMVMNVSIFFAFMGLLKLYHAVREDLQWCRPWPKFLTIKAVVFLTFWQGLAILLYLIATAEDDQKEEAVFEAHKYQNMLICVEMLLVAISQWCVFPAIEWEPNYDQSQIQTPSLGFEDFASDVGEIVKNPIRRAYRKGKKSLKKKRGGYHLPGFTSYMSSQYDGLAGPAGNGGGGGGGDREEDTFEDDENYSSYDESSVNNSYDSSLADDNDQLASDDQNDASSPDHRANRERIRSDDTGASGYSLDSQDDEMEML